MIERLVIGAVAASSSVLLAIGAVHAVHAIEAAAWAWRHAISAAMPTN